MCEMNLNTPAPPLSGTMDVDEFMAFLEARPDGEHWELFEGVAVMMAPPNYAHQRISSNLSQLLNSAFAAGKLDLFAYIGTAVRSPGVRNFQPQPDVVVVPGVSGYELYSERFQLAAEVLSPTNRRQEIDMKLRAYCEAPDNLYAVGPAVLPTMGSPNPMLSGVALARRLADHLVPLPTPAAPESKFEYLFDGTERTFNAWQAVGQCAFALVDGAIVAQPSGGLGLLYYARRAFGDFTLRLQFRISRLDDNSGVFVRFRDPRRPVPDRNNPAVSHAYDNQAWVGVDTGFEVQIDEQAKGDPQKGIPDGLDKHRTGAIYNIDIGMAVATQSYRRGPALVAGAWNDYEINVQGDTYTVKLNGQETTTFTNKDAFRGKSALVDPFCGYLGLQAHTGTVAFRRIRIVAK